MIVPHEIERGDPILASFLNEIVMAIQQRTPCNSQDIAHQGSLYGFTSRLRRRQRPQVDQAYARVSQSGSTAMSSGVLTPVVYTLEEADTDGYYDGATPNRFTIPAGTAQGLYLVGGHCGITATDPIDLTPAEGASLPTLDNWYVTLAKNGTNLGTYIGGYHRGSGGGGHVADMIEMAATDYVQMEAYSNDSSPGYSNAVFWIIRLRERDMLV